jgi:hypothetical protein
MKQLLIISMILITTAIKSFAGPSMFVVNNTSCSVTITLYAHDMNNTSCAAWTMNTFIVAGGGAHRYFADVATANTSPAWTCSCSVTVASSGWDQCDIDFGTCTTSVGATCTSLPTSTVVYCCALGGSTSTWSDDGFGNITVTIN